MELVLQRNNFRAMFCNICIKILLASYIYTAAISFSIFTKRQNSQCILQASSFSHHTRYALILEISIRVEDCTSQLSISQQVTQQQTYLLFHITFFKNESYTSPLSFKATIAQGHKEGRRKNNNRNQVQTLFFQTIFYWSNGECYSRHPIGANTFTTIQKSKPKSLPGQLKQNTPSDPKPF